LGIWVARIGQILESVKEDVSFAVWRIVIEVRVFLEPAFESFAHAEDEIARMLGFSEMGTARFTGG
jgi:hypothetical protein